MKRINWSTLWQGFVLILVIVLIAVQVWARWTVCKGDLACFVVGPKYVVTPDQSR